MTTIAQVQPSRRGSDRPRRAVRRWVLGTAVRGVLGLPLAVAAVPMALVGAAGPAARAQRALVRRFQPRRAGEGETSPGALRVLAHSALVAVPALAGLVALGLGAFCVYSGYLYFLRPDASFAIGHPFTADPHFDDAWGGPTLFGAWLAHSGVALGIQLLALGLIHALTALQDRVTRRLLG